MSKSHSYLAAGVLLAAVVPVQAITFTFNYAPFTDPTSGQVLEVSPEMRASCQRAADFWTATLTNDIHMSVKVSMVDTNGIGGPGNPILANADYRWGIYSYSDVRDALASHATSDVDYTALSHLETGSTYSYMVNRTTDGEEPHLFAAAELVTLSAANAKVLGFTPVIDYDPGADGVIKVTNNPVGVQYDYDPSDGITPGTRDFTGIIAHEIGHTLGFLSGVGDLETERASGTVYDDAFTDSWCYAFDLFRYASYDGKLVRDLTLGDSDKFFSIDGVNQVAQLSTGYLLGDHYYAGHWKYFDSLEVSPTDPGTNRLGLMQPRLPDLVGLTSIDRDAFDVMGYTIAGRAVVPEPTGLALVPVAAVVLGRRRR